MLHINYTRQKLSPLARRRKVLENLESSVLEGFITEAQAASLYDATIAIMQEETEDNEDITRET